MNAKAPRYSEEAIREALREVIDPEVGINIVDLGMVGAVEIGEQGRLVIELVPTTAGCPMHETLAEGARHVAGTVPGVGEVEVRFCYDPPWTPDRITPEGREALGM